MGEELAAAGSGLRAHRDAMGRQAGRIDHQQAQITDIGIEALVSPLQLIGIAGVDETHLLQALAAGGDSVLPELTRLLPIGGQGQVIEPAR